MDELSQELKDIIIKIAQGLEPKQILEGLKEILERDKCLINDQLDAEMHGVICYEIAVLVAAIEGYEKAISNSGLSK